MAACLTTMISFFAPFALSPSEGGPGRSFFCLGLSLSQRAWVGSSADSTGCPRFHLEPSSTDAEHTSRRPFSRQLGADKLTGRRKNRVVMSITCSSKMCLSQETERRQSFCLAQSNCLGLGKRLNRVCRGPSARSRLVSEALQRRESKGARTSSVKPSEP